MAKVFAVWECDDCGALYETEQDARACCPNTVTYLEGEYFKCAECEKIHKEEHDAQECCK